MIVNHLIERGFNNIIQFNCDANEKPYTIDKNKIYAKVHEVKGERLVLSNLDNILYFTEILADFHSSSQGFIKPSGIKIKTEWGKLIEKYKTMTRRIDKYIRLTNQKGITTKFEEDTWRFMEPLMNRADISIKVFKSPIYLKVLEKSMLNMEICLNTMSDSLAVNRNGTIIIKNIFDLSYNMALEDICKLIKKGFEGNDARIVYYEVINSYSKIKRIDENSRVVINAILNFPYDSLKVINRYLDNKNEETVLVEKFKKQYEIEQRSNIWGGLNGI